MENLLAGELCEESQKNRSGGGFRELFVYCGDLGGVLGFPPSQRACSPPLPLTSIILNVPLTEPPLPYEITVLSERSIAGNVPSGQDLSSNHCGVIGQRRAMSGVIMVRTFSIRVSQSREKS